MKKLFIKCAIFLVIVSSFNSCDLDVVPPAEIVAEDFWKTEKDAWYALNSCYATMPALDIWDEMTTDNAHSHKPWEGNFELVQQDGISTASPYGDYSYNGIRIVNNFIENVEKIDMDASLKERMKAEARFFRAFSYLELTEYYGKVPLVENVLDYDAPNVPRANEETIHEYILTELDEISKILPENYSGGFLQEAGRITKYGALALRARAALYFKNYEEAEKSAKAVIDSQKYSLFRLTSLNDAQQQEADEMDLFIDFDELGIDKNKFINGMFSYVALWHKSNASPSNPEYVVTREYMDDANNSDDFRYTYFIPLSMSIQSGYSSFEPMQDLIDAYWDSDGKTMRDNISIDQRKANYAEIWNHVKDMSKEDYKDFATSEDLMSYNYMKEFKNRDSRLYSSYMFPFKGWHNSAKGEFYYKWDPSVVNRNGNESWTGFSYRKMVAIDPYDRFGSAADYPTIRYAEVLLTFAEARLMNSGYDIETQMALNDIRDRAGMPDVPSNLSKQEAISFVRNERRIELAVEGHRYNDIRRYEPEYRQEHLNGPSTAPDGSIVVDKHWSERLMLMPIPTGAMDRNPLLDQNPGY